MKNTQSKLFTVDVQKILSRFNGMIFRNGGRGWINWLLKVNFVLRGGNTSALARSAVVATRFFYGIARTKGIAGLVLWTKNANILLMQSVAGHRLANASSLGTGVKRDRSGIPRLIPRDHRILIRSGDLVILRIWLSWFSIYRVLEYPGTLKLSTITEIGTDWNSLIGKEALQSIRMFCSDVLFEDFASVKLKSPIFVPLSKTTPSIYKGKCKVSWGPLGIYSGGLALINSSVYPSYCYLLSFYTRWEPKCTFNKVWQEMVNAERLSPVHNFRRVGKLGLKQEPAGKVRVFAMVECWTQWILNPLHDYVFKKLSLFETDGTMDQMAPVNRLIEQGKTRFWCYDLSAATDRLPVDLQANILNFLFGESFGWAWKNLLVGRDYDLPVRLPKGISIPGNIRPASVRYQVGQPMGALSSWAMLALTHHFIVHWAAFRVKIPWGSFWDYAVLGDDIVIANGKVAGSYLTLMDQLGVGIGLHKSLVSRKGVLEFAKRYLVKDKDCSPVPIKEMVASLCNFEGSTEFIRKYELGASSIAGFLGLGYRVRGHLSADFKKINKKLATIGRWKYSPWGSDPQNLQSWINIQSWHIRPNWLVQHNDMWPELGESASSVFKTWVALDSPRLEKIKKLFPERGTYGGNRQLMDWMENKLHAMSYSIGSFYNVLFWIQQEYWERSNPILKAELSEYRSSLFKWKTGTFVPDWKVLEWVEIRTKCSCVHGPRKIGEVTDSKVRPTILFPTRLHKSLGK